MTEWEKALGAAAHCAQGQQAEEIARMILLAKAEAMWEAKEILLTSTPAIIGAPRLPKTSERIEERAAEYQRAAKEKK